MVDINTNPLIGSKLGALPQPIQPPVVGQFRGVKQAQAESSQESDRVGSAQIEYQTATNALRRAQQGLSQAQAEQNALKTDLQSAQGELQSSNQQLQQAQVQAQQFQTQLASARQEMQAKITQGETDYQQALRDLEAKRTASLAQVPTQQPSRTEIGQMTEAQVNALQPQQPAAQPVSPAPVAPVQPAIDPQEQVRGLVDSVNAASLNDPNKVGQQKESLKKLATLRPNAGISQALADFEKTESALNSYMATEYPKFGGRAYESPEFQQISKQLTDARNNATVKLLNASRLAFDQQ